MGYQVRKSGVDIWARGLVVHKATLWTRLNSRWWPKIMPICCRPSLELSEVATKRSLSISQPCTTCNSKQLCKTWVQTWDPLTRFKFKISLRVSKKPLQPAMLNKVANKELQVQTISSKCGPANREGWITRRWKRIQVRRKGVKITRLAALPKLWLIKQIRLQLKVRLKWWTQWGLTRRIERQVILEMPRNSKLAKLWSNSN